MNSARSIAQFVQDCSRMANKMPGVPAIGAFLRKLYFLHSRQLFAVQRHQTAARRRKPFQLAELVNADCRLDVSKVVFEPGLEHLVIPFALFRVAVPGVFADAVQAQHPHAFGERGFVRRRPCRLRPWSGFWSHRS